LICNRLPSRHNRIVKNFIELTCKDGDRVAIAVDQIRSFVEYSDNKIAKTKVTFAFIHAQETSNGGDPGSSFMYVKETYDEVKAKIVAAQSGDSEQEDAA
jgi:hypothetical protein